MRVLILFGFIAIAYGAASTDRHAGHDHSSVAVRGRQKYRSGTIPSVTPMNPHSGRRRGSRRDPHAGHHHKSIISEEHIANLTRRFKTNVDRLKAQNNLDLIFLIDESKSVGITNFYDEIKFVARFVSGIAVDINNTRVAVVTFADAITTWVNQVSVGEIHAHKCSLLGRDLPSIVYVGGGTFTRGALERTEIILENARVDSKKVVFLITDGYSNGGDPIFKARQLKRRGVEIFTFGIREGNEVELKAIASDPKDDHCLILNDFKEFDLVARRALHSGSWFTTYYLQ